MSKSYANLTKRHKIT